VKRIAIFASGTGTNALKILEHLHGSTEMQVALLLTNKPDAPVVSIFENRGIDIEVVDRQSFYHSEKILYDLRKKRIDFIVLAGFLWLLPYNLVNVCEKRIINIHPALLPKFGGKGMYGMKVHEAVRAANEEESGITIHYVDERYDKGAVIFQAKCKVSAKDTPQDIAHKVQKLEHEYFPKIVEKLVRQA
jgi:phosphoribosylglycinamide formyltransferase-1